MVFGNVSPHSPPSLGFVAQLVFRGPERNK